MVNVKTIGLLVSANIRKSKSQTVSLFLVVLLTGFFLHLGYLLMVNFPQYFDEESQRVHGIHAALLQSESFNTPDQEAWLKTYPGVTEIEKQTVLFGNADISFNHDKLFSMFMLVRESEDQNMNPLSLIGECHELSDGKIYLPYMMKTSGQMELGEDFSMSLQGREYHYTIAGFTNELFFGSPSLGWYRFYVNDATYDQFQAAHPESVSSLQTIRMENPYDADLLATNFARHFYYETTYNGVAETAAENYHFHIGYANAKTGRTFMANITSVILLALAMVILTVSLVVIRFRIYNSIREGMANIGSLKAIGFLNRQIFLSLLVQFGVITVLGTLMGITVSYLALPGISSVLEMQTALIWHQNWDIRADSISLSIILVLVLAVTALAARHIRKLPPLVALRGGIQNHNFRRNLLPLHRSRGGLVTLLALKSALGKKRQTVMLGFIIACVTFAAGAGLSIYYNIGVHNNEFIGLVGGEVPDVVLVTAEADALPEIMGELPSYPGVDRAIYFSRESVMIREMIFSCMVTDDYSLTSEVMLYEGRSPKYDNEIAIGGIYMASEGLGIGDTVPVTYRGKSENYLITGLIQSMNEGGFVANMTTQGIERIVTDFQPTEIYVYLSESGDPDLLMDVVGNRYPGILSGAVNMKKLAEVQLSVLSEIFSVLAVIIVLATMLIVLLVLYLILKTVIIRRRREFGIQKAIGFTTRQLMQQIALSFTPAILLGTIFGCLFGIGGFNALFVILVRNMGIMTASMPPSIPMILVMGVGIILFSYVISLAIAWRIRKISPCELGGDRN